MLGYWLDESYWGKGYMTEAVQGVLNYGFEELRLSLITATCYPHNKRSQKVLKKNGFIYEGTLHQAELTYNGNIYDHQCYYLPGISQPTPEDYDEILHVWEMSVRHTHDFLTEEHIQFYKPLVRKHYLPAVELFVIRNANGKIAPSWDERRTDRNVIRTPRRTEKRIWQTINGICKRQKADG